MLFKKKNPNQAHFWECISEKNPKYIFLNVHYWKTVCLNSFLKTYFPKTNTRITIQNKLSNEMHFTPNFDVHLKNKEYVFFLMDSIQKTKKQNRFLSGEKHIHPNVFLSCNENGIWKKSKITIFEVSCISLDRFLPSPFCYY